MNDNYYISAVHRLKLLVCISDGNIPYGRGNIGCFSKSPIISGDRLLTLASMEHKNADDWLVR